MYEVIKHIVTIPEFWLFMYGLTKLIDKLS